VAAGAVQFLSASATAGIFILITLYLQRVLGYTALQAGFIFVVPGLGFVAAGIVAVRTSWLSVRVRLLGGLAVQFTGTAVLSIEWSGHPLVGLLLGSWLDGFGTVSVLVAATTAITAAVGDRHLGLAAGLLNTAVELGSACGIAGLVAVATVGANGTSPGDSFDARGFFHAMMVALAATGLAALVALLVPARGSELPAAR
jgi:hypothetical protein